jgi:hypothetical protein
MKKTLVLLTAGILTIAASLQSCKNGSGAGNAVALKLNLAPGTKYAYTMDSKTTMNTSGLNSTQTMEMAFSYEVAAGEGTDKKLMISYDHINSEASTPVGTVRFNTEDSSIPGLKEFLSRPFIMTVSEKGLIKNIEGLERIDSSELPAGDEEAQNIRRQIEATFTDSAMRISMESMLNIYPDNAVKPGDNWVKTSTISTAGMSMKVENTYKLLSVKDNTAHIEVKSKISNGGGSMEAQGMPIKIELNGTSDGTMDVDVTTGFMTASKMKQDIDGTMSMSGMKAPVKMIMEISVTGKKK